ncbi:Drug/Metabolite Transporter (DMT) Superfamily [Thraustotheca clavata]|uniref:Drug/Metabolite Transporter (DMT) Superfamily n=1 Tax=Thraustotheca clavata TaxID=74557 RepID=A0A1W0AB94_9STRA|nr:Drug/Metabolite Transporter (DMT) Superfamily [Thraustotheca clavata]
MLKEQLPLVSTERHPHRLLGLLFVAASAFAFSLVSLAVKYESSSMSSMESVFWRSLFSWSVTKLHIIVQKQNLYVDSEYTFYLTIRCVVGFASMALGFWTITQMALADASVLIFTSPVIAALLSSVLLQEALDPVCLTCALISFGGVICVSRPTFLFGEQDEAVVNGSKFAVLGGLLAASAQALVYVSVRKLKELHFLVVINYFFLTCLIFSGFWMWIFQENFVWPQSASIWASVIASGVFGYFGQLFLTKGFQLESVGIASIMRYLDIVFVFIWDGLLIQEPINKWSILGALIICACAIAITVRKARF